MAQYELNLRDYVRVIRKRKFIVIFSAFSMGFFSFFFASLQKPIPIYRAASSVKIETSTNPVGLYLQTVSFGETSNLDTQVTIIKSIPIMEFVAKRMGLIDENLTPEEIRREAKYINQVLNLRDKVSVSIEGMTNIIGIEVIDTSPKFAQRLANTVAEVYKEQNTLEKNKRIIEAKKYIASQLTVTEEKLRAEEERLKEFREKNRIVTIESQTSETLRSLTESEKEYAYIKQEKAAIETLMQDLKKQKALPKEKFEGFYAEKVGPIFSTLNTKLVDLYAQRDLMLLDLNENHPEIERINVQIDKVISNMINHLADQKKRLSEKEQFLSAELQKTKAKFSTLPQLGFQLQAIERELNINKNLYETLKTKQQEVLISEAEKVEEVSIVRPALLPQFPLNPPTTGRTAAIGTMIGIILGLVIAFVFETMDTSIGTIEDVETFLGVPVLGVVPFIRPEEIEDNLVIKTGISESGDIPEHYNRLITHFAPKTTMAESFRTLRTGIKFLCLEKGLKTLLFSSATAGEGKSTAAANVALVFAQIGSKTLFVDGDLRKPVVSRFFGIEREPGLTDVILGNYDWKEVVRTVTDIMVGKLSMEEIMVTPGFDNLNIITSGSVPPNPSEILNSQRMTDFIAQAKAAYDIVIFDTAPILPATDAVILGSKVDGVLIVYRVGKVARGALKRAKSQMDHIRANVLGTVLNRLKPEVSTDYQYYKYYKYYSAYGTKGKEAVEELPWYKRIIQKLKSLIIKDKKEISQQEAPQAGKGLREKISRWGRWIKIFLLASSIIALLVGLLWQFEILKYLRKFF
ncbi:MAG: polysaccharide biosynthesis tyrosine autokinase [Planctomycetota bacterium]|nr:polysaccharide biosynthesis tyrosine autokinase [Planctomycetota bacterium]